MNSLKIMLFKPQIREEMKAKKWAVDEVTMTKQNSIRLRASSATQSLLLICANPHCSNEKAQLEGAYLTDVLVSQASNSFGTQIFYCVECKLLTNDGVVTITEGGVK